MPSFDRPAAAETAISPWLGRFAHLLPPGARALDLACGHGRHTRWLLRHGCMVTAVDIDVSGLAGLAGDSRLEVLAADLETGRWPLAGRRFDAVLVTNYLHRPLFPLLAAALNPGGILLIDTFAAGNERLGRPRNPDFLLAPGELLAAFAQQLEIIAYEFGEELLPRPAVRERLCAVNGAGPVPLFPEAVIG